MEGGKSPHTDTSSPNFLGKPRHRDNKMILNTIYEVLIMCFTHRRTSHTHTHTHAHRGT